MGIAGCGRGNGTGNAIRVPKGARSHGLSLLKHKQGGTVLYGCAHGEATLLSNALCPL